MNIKPEQTPRPDHVHHWVPMTTGKRNAQREPIQELRCACGLSYAQWQGMGSPEC